MNLSMIIATDTRSGIGYNNALPWPHNKDDMAWFVRQTKGKIVVMGRNTWESLPTKPLPDRTNIVVTKEVFDKATVCLNCDGDSKVLVEKLVAISKDREVVVMGGARLYTLLWPYVTKIYRTLFDQEYLCDTFFNVDQAIQADPRQWKITQKTYQGNSIYSVLETSSNPL